LDVATFVMVQIDQAVDDIDAARHAEIEKAISGIAHPLGEVLSEVGCICLAEKFGGLKIAGTPGQADGGACSASNRRSSLLLLAKMAPLARALAASGYYDYALRCIEIAMIMEPTWDLKLARAYLLIALGDSDQACEVYKAAIRSWGNLPAQEIDLLNRFADVHCEEEDVKELILELKKYVAG